MKYSRHLQAVWLIGMLLPAWLVWAACNSIETRGRHWFSLGEAFDLLGAMTPKVQLWTLISSAVFWGSALGIVVGFLLTRH